MRKIGLIIALTSVSYLSFGQGVADVAAEAACQEQENLLKPILKSSEHPKRGIKSSTWIRLAEAYTNYTTMCGKDSTSGIKAWEAIQKAKELDTDGKEADNIEAVMHGQAMYSATMNQGVAHYNNGNMDMAEKLFGIAATVTPTDSMAAQYTAMLANQQGHTEDAIKYYTQYIETAGGRDPSSYYTLAMIEKKEGDIDGAIAWLKRGIEDTDNKDLRGELVNTYIQEDRLDEAIRDLQDLVNKDPKNVGALLNLGLIYDNEGDKEKALETYNKVLELDPDNYDCNFSIAVIHFNNAVKVKNEVDAMDMETYKKEGQAVLDKACAEFTKSKPYFEKCNSVKPNQAEVTNSLDSLNGILAQCNK
ncbi:tetratricopeptide repeat protein [Marinilongibacter aquaticus]|uniref:tetratricopeptide repeat protein n=1 Tax=Marinilongibacter aquaticus TaxID=2975157 RepID=UPI0021BDD450|nr:tetratricopeptide repeat protein [Marinilongibacter aquaticus]UBM59457.1 tetratricopeptide repeat protein [Marinilongibacter aquaticus]